jgi:hypothetical protein
LQRQLDIDEAREQATLQKQLTNQSSNDQGSIVDVGRNSIEDRLASLSRKNK